MARTLPPLTWFRAFEAAARHLSFTAAAAELNLTQSAISQQVRSLELRFGSSLFQRKARGLALTDAGRRLLPQVSGAIESLSAAATMFGVPDRAGDLTVACTASFGALWLVPRLAGFLRLAPGAQVRLVSRLWPDEALAGEANVEIRYGLARNRGEGDHLLCADRLVPVCAPGLIAGLPDRALTWAAMQSLPLIQTVGLADTWHYWTKAQNLPPPRQFAHTVDSHGLAVDMARAGLGVALTHSALIAPIIESGGLTVPVFERVPAQEGYIANLSKSGDLASRFLEWLIRENPN